VLESRVFPGNSRTTHLGPFGEVIRETGSLAKLNPFRFSTKYDDDETGLLYYGYRYYNPSTGRWPSRDPMGEQGGLNLYGFCLNRPIDDVDLLGMGLLENMANLMGSVGDNLTFGLTAQARKGLNWMFFDGDSYDSGVNTGSGWYTAGTITEVTVEIGVTMGGAALRHTARLAVRETLEGGARKAFRAANDLEGGVVHHINPIKGHPGGGIARYPLPFEWAAQGSWNMKWVPSTAAHMAEHANMLRLEALDELREATLGVRQAANQLANMASQACDWSVDVSAHASGSSSQTGPIPPTPSAVIQVDVQSSASGQGSGDQ
jgi:RHS repeat-associated protein